MKNLCVNLYLFFQLLNMKKNFLFLVNNKINYLTNFYNFLTQINIKFQLFKINSFLKNHYKLIFIKDNNEKINQFVNSLKKCTKIKKIYSFKNLKKIFYNAMYYNYNCKILKNFILVNYNNFFLFYYNLKKEKYALSIMNNFIFYKNIFIL
ncbi:hypothetical protein AMC76_00840 [Candidatus Carsonella ruddii]|nr:hypothetical protein CRDC_00780 [Candidatus Carsonella ruddii DC]ALA96880.1 hypothetical protein AMC76_00840 [Candidatus Carsonella ruddii]